LKYANYPGIRFVGVDRYKDPRSQHWPESCSLVLATGDHLPFTDGSFDGAICNFVFEHLERPEPTLRELSRLIRPDGFLFVSIPFSNSFPDRLYRFALKGGGHLQRYSFESFLRMVYRETRFKLRAFAPMQSGLTWLSAVPLDNVLHRLLFQGLRWMGKGGVYPLDGSDCQFLFIPGSDRGYRTSVPSCTACGVSGIRTVEASWICADCGFRNTTVPSGLEISC